MLATIDIEQKIMGNALLLAGLKLSIEDGEKIAIIGRNGVGKTTLFNMLAGSDKDYTGTISFRNGITLAKLHVTAKLWNGLVCLITIM
jgi:ATP-binding cassette subfamily F protein 3